MKKSKILVFFALVCVVILSVAACNKTQITALSAPVISANGKVVSWEGVENASSYEIFVDEVSKGKQEALDYTVAETAPGSYSVTVKAIGDGTSYSDSELSNAVTVVVSATLAAPSISAAENVVSWAAVANASKYEVFIDGVSKGEQTGLSYTLTETEPNDYVITVKAIGNGTTYLNSALSNQVTVTIQNTAAEPLAAPAITASANVISWLQVSNADKYNIYADGSLITTVTALTYTYSASAVGDYVITVKAASDSVNYLESPASNAQTLTFVKYNAPVITFNKTTKLWSATGSGTIMFSTDNSTYSTDTPDALSETTTVWAYVAASGLSLESDKASQLITFLTPTGLAIELGTNVAAWTCDGTGSITGTVKKNDGTAESMGTLTQNEYAITTGYGSYTFELMASSSADFTIGSSATFTVTYYGKGTETDPYAISDKASFDVLMGSTAANVADAEFIQTANFDINTNATPDIVLNGNYDGKGFKITYTFTQNDHSLDTYAIFKEIAEGASLTNLKVDITIQNWQRDALSTTLSGLTATNNGTISYVTVNGKIQSNSYDNIAGIAGINNGTITNSASGMEIEAYRLGDTQTGSDNCGGIAGINNGTISFSTNSGKLAVAGKKIGGIAGVNSGTITNCVNSGAIKGEGHNGGITGVNNKIITLCSNSGVISGGGNSGGIAGAHGGEGASGSTAYIDSCYNTANSEDKGGIVGDNYAVKREEGSVRNCYTTFLTVIDYDGSQGTGWSIVNSMFGGTKAIRWSTGDYVAGTNDTNTVKYSLSAANVARLGANFYYDETGILLVNSGIATNNVSFLNFDGTAIAAFKVTSGLLLKLAPALSNSAEYSYVFKKFDTDYVGSAIDFTEGFTVSENVVFKSERTKNSYTITFDNQGAGEDITKEYGETISQSDFDDYEAPVKDGYTFEGWFTGENGTGTEFEFGTTTVVGTQTYHAYLKAVDYIVTYHNNYGDDATTEKTFNYDMKTDLTNNITRPNYVFLGWASTNSATEGQKTFTLAELKALQTSQGSNNLVLYAVWEEAGFAIVYHANNGTITDTGYTENFKAGDTTIVLPTVERTNYTFDGWYLDAGFSGAAIDVLTFDLSDHLGADLNLYAKFTADTASFNVDFVTHGGSAISSDSVLSGQDFVLPTTSRQHYILKGWSLTENGALIGNAGDTFEFADHSTADSATLTLHAVWEAVKYTITIDVGEDGLVLLYDGEEVELVNGKYVIEFTVEDGIIDLSLYTTSKTNFTFDGWYIEADDGTVLTSFDTALYGGNVVLLPKFTEIPEGSINRPWIIAQDSDIEDILLTKNAAGVYFKQTTDISAAGSLFTAESPFLGNYDGGNFTYTITTDTDGLFGYIGAGATVSNLTVSGTVHFTESVGMSGILAKENAGAIDNVITEGTIISDAGSVNSSPTDIFTGGIVGKNSGTINNSINNANVNGKVNAGGIAGYNAVGAEITLCINNGYIGKIDAEEWKAAQYNSKNAGICAINEGEISQCGNNGSVKTSKGEWNNGNSNNENAGLVYKNTATGVIDQSYNKGEVQCDYAAAGLVVINDGSVSNCYNSGSIRSRWIVAVGIFENNGTAEIIVLVGDATIFGKDEGGWGNCIYTIGKNASAGTVSNLYYGIDASASDGFTGSLLRSPECQSVENITDDVKDEILDVNLAEDLAFATYFGYDADAIGFKTYLLWEKE